jgi:hypothetical protein
VTDKLPLGGNLVGLFGFSEQWVASCKRLIALKIRELKVKAQKAKLPKEEAIPDFAFAPRGHFGALVTIECGSAFVTIAKRALEGDRLFERSSFAEAVLEAELEPFGKTIADLSTAGRNRAMNRIAMSITRLMRTLEFFGLFETTNKARHIYRLTDLGVKTYEALSTDPEEQSLDVIDAGSGIHFVGYGGICTAGGGHTQVTLHSYY